MSYWTFGDLDFSVFSGSSPETRLLLEKYCTDEPEALLCTLTVFIRFSNDIIWRILTDLYPDPYRISHINYTLLFIHIGLLPSSLNTIFLLSYLYGRVSLDFSPWGEILIVLYWERGHFLLRIFVTCLNHEVTQHFSNVLNLVMKQEALDEVHSYTGIRWSFLWRLFEGTVFFVRLKQCLAYE